MARKSLLLFFLLFSFLWSQAAFVSVPVSGYNADVVANGTGSSMLSTNNDVDGANYAFMAPDFNPSGTTPTQFLPATGLINSANTSGLPYQLAGYSVNNSLRIPATGTGTLTFNTPQSASDVYLLMVSGSGATTINVTVTFTDLTTQVFSGIAVSDWYGGSSYAILGLGRVNKATDGIDNNTTNPRLYETKVTLSPSNYSKQIQSVTFAKTATAGVLNVMGISINALAPCVTPANQPTALVLNAGVTSTTVAFTAASPAPDKYLIVRSVGTAALSANPVNGTTYTVGSTIGNGTVISASNSISITDAGLTSLTTYRYTIFAYNDLCASAITPVYNTTNPLTGTIATNGITTYTWNGSVSTNWTVAGNWTPARNVPDATDILQFNNGTTNTVTNIPTQTISRLLFTNNTIANFQAPSTATLTINSDGVPTTDELSVAQGSAIISNGTSATLTVVFGGTGATATIAGTIESVTGTFTHTFNFTNSVTTVTATGLLAGGGTSGTNVLLGSATSLIMNGTYQHKYTTGSGPAIPTATWNAGSTVLITGYTTATGGPNGGMNQVFSNFIYNCTAQTSNTNWSGTGPLTVTGTFTMQSTGTGTLQWGSTQGYNYVVNNYVQTGGTLNMNSGVATATPILSVTGSFNQTGGTFTSTGASTGANAPVLHFNGTAVQNVSFFNAAPVGPITYRISNPNGINLSGTGTLTGAFGLNNSGGIRISTAAANPINTSLSLTYAGNALLTYDVPGSATVTASVWPSSAGPTNVTLNTGGSSNIITLPFSRTISGTFTMTSGDLNLANNTLTLGTSASTTGTLNYTTGNIRLTTGSMVRWYGTSGLPTAAGIGVGFYPVAYGGANRNVAVYFSTATALSTGGSIEVTHNNVTGLTTGLSVADGAYTINTRINSNWGFNAGGGIAASGTINIKLTGDALFSSPNPANLRAMLANAVVGTHIAGSGNSAFRTGLSVGDLNTGPFYIGAAAPDMGGVFIAINTGLWSAGTTWDAGVAPSITDNAYINTNVTVTADAATNAAKSLNILANGNLVINANTVTLDSALANNGSVNIGGGTLVVNGNSGASGVTATGGSLINISSGTMTVGPSGGGNKPFVSAGVVTVSGGALNVNGNFLMSPGSTLNQSGGNIRVDGNAGGVAASSVAGGTVLVSLQSPGLNLTGGNFMIVDPHASATQTRSFEYNTTAGHVNLPATHNFVFGDGTSTDPGGDATFGYRINLAFTTSRLQFGSVIINGASGTNRFVSPGNAVGVSGNFTVNNGGEYRFTSNNLYVNGNLTVNTGGTLTTNGTLVLANYASAAQASGTNAQLISGAGTYRNLTASPTGNFTSITIQNTNGATFDIGNPIFSGTVTFTAGATGPSRITMANNSILCERAGAGQSGASATAGWVVGAYQKGAAVGGMNHNFPIGDATQYTPVNVSSTGTGVTTAGDIWARTTTLDHPSINTSTLNPARSVNRYYTIQGANGVVFASGALTATFNWVAADVDPGSVTANFKVGAFASAAWTLPTTASPTATSIQITGMGPLIDAQYQVAELCGPTVIGTQPVAQTVCAGSPVTFTVAATGSAIAYQWKKGTTNITGATNASYTIPATVAGDAGNYSVVITSACTGQAVVTSAVVALTVNLPPAITTQPVSQTICENSPVTFTVVATGTGLTYQWMKGTTNITGATNASYTISSVATGDAGNYSVQINGSSPCGNLVSNIATLTVNPLNLSVNPPGPIVFCVGGSIVLNASNTAGYTYQWKQNTNNIAGATNVSYTATTTGSYTVLVTNTNNGCSNTSAAVSVTANTLPPASVTPAPTASFCQGGSLTLNANTGTGFSYQWKQGGTDIPGATNATYSATAAGSYAVTVMIGTGCMATSASTVVTVNPLPAATATAAGATTFCQGGSVTLNANTGTGLTYQWQLNSGNIPGATNATYSATATGTYAVVVTNTNTCSATSNTIAVNVNPLPAATVTAASATTFCQGGSVVLNANTGTGLSYQWRLNTGNIPGATNASYTATASGSYTVVVTNANNCQQTSAATTVTVNPLPNVTATPAGPVAICQNSNVTISVPTATGQTYQWMQGTANISGATNASYTTNAAGTYSVKVTITSSTCNATSNAVVVTVNAIPNAVTTPTGNVTICGGDTLFINANTGTGLTYQWKQGTTDIPGATNQVYPATTSGVYTVAVKNTNTCTAVSAPVNLTVNPKTQSIITYTSPIIFCDGGAVSLEGTQGSGLVYQWKRNSGDIPGATNSTLVVNQSGQYALVLKNAFNCISVSTTVNVTVNPLPHPTITRTNFVLDAGSYIMYQWFLNNQPVPGATNQTHTAVLNGVYYARVTDNNGCTNVSDPMFINNVGISNPGLAQSVKIYPNPAAELVNIEAPIPVNVLLRDLSGRIVLHATDVKQLDISAIASGTYLMYISDKEGRLIKADKLQKNQ